MSYNKFTPISIGGSNLNTIPSTYNSNTINTSLTVSGKSFVSEDAFFKSNVYLGYQTVDPSGNYTDTSGSIIFKIGATTYTITRQMLSYLNGLTSNVQTQINSITSSSGALTGANNSFTGANSFSGTTTFSNTVIVNGANISTVEFSYLDGLTSSIQTQLNNVLPLTGGTLSGALTLSSGGLTTNGDVVNYKIGDNTRYFRYNATNTNWVYWNGTGSTILLNGDAGTGAFSGLLSANGGLTIPSGQTLTVNGSLGGFGTVSGSSCFFNASATYPNTTRTHILNELRVVNNTIPSGGLTGNLSASIGNGFLIGWNAGGAGGVAHFINSTDLGAIGGFRFYNYTNAGVYQSTSLILNSNGTANTPNLLTCDGGLTIPTTKLLNLTGSINANSLTITPVEISYLSGATSNLQSQINSLTSGVSSGYGSLSGTNSWSGANTFSGSTTFNSAITATGSIIANGGISTITTGNVLTFGTPITDGITAAEIYNVKSSTSNIQTQLNGKGSLSSTNSWSGVNNYSANSNFNGDTNFVTGKTCVMNSSFNLNTGLQLDTVFVSKAELKYLNGMTSNIQTQINNSVSNITSNTLQGINSFLSDVYFKSDNLYFGLATSGSDFNFNSSRSDANINLFPSSSSNSTINIGNSLYYPLIKLHDSYYIYRAKVLTGTITLTLPLHQTYIIKTTANITITLPLVTSQHIGMMINFRCISTTSQNITINTNTSNYIIEEGSIIETQSTVSAVGGKKTSASFVVCQLASNNYGWALISNGGTVFRGDATITAGNNITINSTSKIIMDSGALIQTNSAQISDVELSYLDMVSSNIQSQLNSRVDLTTGQTIAGAKVFSDTVYCNNAVNSISLLGSLGLTSYADVLNQAELYSLKSIGSNIQTQLNSKGTLSGTNSWSGANSFSGTTTFTNDVIVNGANISAIEFSYLDTVSSNIQTQLNTINTVKGGIFMFISIASGNFIPIPILKSCPNMALNLYNQAATTGSVTTAQSGAAVGSFTTSPAINLKDTSYLVHPNFGLIVYSTASYTGTILVNYKNLTSSPVFVKGATVTGVSIKVYYNDVELP